MVRGGGAPKHGPEWPRLPNELTSEILTNFVKRTSLILTLVVDWNRMWHRDFGIFPAVMQDGYVREAALALSALHICRLGPPHPRRFFYAACTHSIRASARFRAEVSEVTAENWWQVLLFTLMLMLFHLDATFAAQDIGHSTCANGPWETIMVLRQTALMGRYLSPRLWGSKAGAVMFQGQMDLKLPSDDVALSAMDDLIAYCYGHEKAARAVRKPAGTRAVALRAWTDTICGRPRTWHHVMWWAAIVSDDYCQLLKQGHGLAQVVFLYWCAVMNRTPHRFYLRSCVARLAQGVLNRLSEEDPGEILAWPTNELLTEPGVLFGWMPSC